MLVPASIDVVDRQERNKILVAANAFGWVSSIGYQGFHLQSLVFGLATLSLAIGIVLSSATAVLAIFLAPAFGAVAASEFLSSVSVCVPVKQRSREFVFALSANFKAMIAIPVFATGASNQSTCSVHTRNRTATSDGCPVVASVGRQV
jgi:hypothetical protein